MQIFISTTTGQTAYSVTPTTTIDTLKAHIENQEFIPAGLIRLVDSSSTLIGGTLSANGVEDEDSLTMILEVQGGMRKKWKKKRMRRLRRKRRKMRQRAR